MDTVEVRNNSRRALLIKVPGQALHLQPGARSEVPRAYLQTEELAALVRGGSVIVVAPRPRASAARETSEEETLISADVSPAVGAMSGLPATPESASSAPTASGDERPGAVPARTSKKSR